MKIFKVSIKSISIMPFGSIINTDIKYNLNSNKLLLISLAGIIMQVIMYYIFNLLFTLNIITILTYNIFLIYNKNIILFNIIPIIPLDGSKILISILERFIPYRLSLKLVSFISLIGIILFIFLNSINLNLIMLIIYLFYKTYTDILSSKYIFNKFLLERFLYKVKHQKIKNIKNIKNIYKNRYNFINNIEEYKILAKLFDNKG